MKSKIYSSRYMKVSSKGLIWIPAFVTIGFLLAFPVTELIMLGNWFGIGYSTDQIGLLYENLWRDGFMITGLLVAGLAALFNGISQFWYLYSPRKIDFYHSLPVKRNRWFWYKTLQSLLYYILPYLVMEFFAICIGAMRGFFSLHLMKLAFLLLIFHLLLYLLFYFTVVLVIALTGHYLMGALLLTAVAAYGPVLAVLIHLYESVFYRTYSGGAAGTLELTSPVTLAIAFQGSYKAGNYGKLLVLVILLTIVLGTAGYYAYVHRSSERTGQAFVYRWPGIVVRFLIVVPTGLGIGLIFYLLPTDDSRIIWWVFGMILGTLLSGGIMGVIYHMDFRKFFSGKFQFVISVAAVALLACVFYFDMTGYDRYLPAYDQIQNIKAGFEAAGMETSNNIIINQDGTVSWKTVDSNSALTNGNNLGISEEIYNCIENIEKESSKSTGSWLGVKSVLNRWDETGEFVALPVGYELKSGRTVHRSYWVNREYVKELLKAGYAKGTLKEERYSVLGLDDKYADEVSCTFIDGQNISLFQDNRAKKEQLIDALRQDVFEASPEILTGEPCAVLSIEYPNVPAQSQVDNMVPGKKESTSYLSGYFYVYPEFKRTVEILKETGYPVSMKDVNITSVTIQYYMNEDHNEYSSPVVYEEAGQLEELKKVLKCYQLVQVWENKYTDQWGDLTVKINGEESMNIWVIPENAVPEFVQEDAKRALAFEVIDEK